MTTNAILQLVLYFALLVLLAPPLGAFIARVYTGKSCGIDRALGPIERLIYRLCGISPDEEMTWRRYAAAFLVFSAAGLVVLIALQLLQGRLPLNPNGLPDVASFHLAFNTAVSFVTNTNWQAYGGESTMTHLTQMAGLAVQNFLSAAAGMAVLAAVIRGFARKNSETVGSFWVDLVRGTLYVLVPLSIVVALLLVSQGVPQTLNGAHSAQLVESAGGATEQSIFVGPVASQVAIKQLGTNGGGYFNVNSAHPFENSSPLSNLIECLSILLIAGALCFTFGRMVGDSRQGRALFAAMSIVFLLALAACVWAEQSGNDRIAALGVDGPNMEGKETRFGIANSALWATATTCASNGSVNAMHDSFTPLGGMIPLLLIQLGEVIFGGVGSGLYGMLAFVVIAVFVCGMMVGRTPEYLGKKIEPFELKMASLSVLVVTCTVLIGTAIALFTDAGRGGMANPGSHGFSEVLYAWSSAANNNGSAFGGYTANTPFSDYGLGIAMLIGRYATAVPLIAMAGALARKKKSPVTAGTMPTHGVLFVIVLVGVILLSAALNFFPALALGPIAEHLSLPSHG